MKFNDMNIQTKSLQFTLQAEPPYVLVQIEYAKFQASEKKLCWQGVSSLHIAGASYAFS